MPRISIDKQAAAARAAILGDRLPAATVLRALGRTERTLYLWRARGLPVLRLNGQMYISPADLQEFLSQRPERHEKPLPIVKRGRPLGSHNKPKPVPARRRTLRGG